MLNNKKMILLGIVALIFVLIFEVHAFETSKSAEINAYINQLVKDHPSLNKKQVQRWFQQAKFNPHVIEKMERPYEAKPWYEYEQFYVTDKRINAGVEFWNKNNRTLLRAEKIYGVPSNIIVAIIGVESNYAEKMGDFNVFDSLMTFAFSYPKRANFFRNELTQFILLCHERHWDPLKIKGSYAGAIGMAQFMPSSYRNYTVDFSHQGKKDLINNQSDAIGSIANYLKANGWQANGVIAVPATIRNPIDIKIDNSSAKPIITIKQLETQGIIPKAKIDPINKAKLYQFDDNGKQAYWLGLNNFYVITRYNTDPKYALAVYLLAEKIAQAKNHSPLKKTIASND